MLDLGVDLYYAKHYTNGSRWTKFFNKKKTPSEFVRNRVPMFQTWSYVLNEVLTEEQVKLLDMWNWSRHKEEYVAIKALLNAAESGDILLDNELCWFVNKYKGEKDV